jgi:hypothetical protein
MVVHFSAACCCVWDCCDGQQLLHWLFLLSLWSLMFVRVKSVVSHRLPLFDYRWATSYCCFCCSHRAEQFASRAIYLGWAVCLSNLLTLSKLLTPDPGSVTGTAADFGFSHLHSNNFFRQDWPHLLHRILNNHRLLLRILGAPSTIECCLRTI